MRILVDSLIEGARRAHGTVVIIDVFRAFTTEAVAFRRGAKKIILVGSPEEALRLRNEGIADLCVGEVQRHPSTRIRLQQLPLRDVAGRLGEQGHRALHHGGHRGCEHAAVNADAIYVGSLVIARSTVEAILRDSPDLVTIVAMGDGGKVRTDEDEQCALYMRNLLEGRRPDPDAVRSLVMACDQAAKYDDPARPHFRPEDREAALMNRQHPVRHQGIPRGRDVGVAAGRCTVLRTSAFPNTVIPAQAGIHPPLPSWQRPG